jgi:hypothetical protein
MDNKDEMKTFYKNTNLLIDINHQTEKITSERKNFIKENISKKRMNFSLNPANSFEIKLENLNLPNETFFFHIENLVINKSK